MNCASSGRSDETTITLPEPPSEITACFRDAGVPAPRPGPMTSAQVAALVAQFKKSETKLQQCGLRFEGWYQSLAAGLRK